MKLINLNKELTGAYGGTIPNTDTRLPMTFRDACFGALLTSQAADDRKKKEEKYAIYKILSEAKEEATLTVGQIAVIEKGMEIHPTLIMGQCLEMIENNTIPDNQEPK